MIYILAFLLPPLGLLFNGQPFSAVFSVLLIVFCLIFGWLFPVLFLVPSIHGAVAGFAASLAFSASCRASSAPRTFCAASATCGGTGIDTGPPFEVENCDTP